jgi:hypothetical protein
MTDTVSLSTLATNTVCVSVSTVRAEQGSEMDLADHLVVLLQGPPLRKVNQCHARSLSLGTVTGNTGR